MLQLMFIARFYSVQLTFITVNIMLLLNVCGAWELTCMDFMHAAAACSNKMVFS